MMEYKEPYYKNGIPKITFSDTSQTAAATTRDYIASEGNYINENYSREEMYERLCKGIYWQDNHQLAPIYRHFASKCHSVTEFGTAIGCSARGLLSGLPKKFTFVDCLNTNLIIATTKYLKTYCDRYDIEFRHYHEDDAKHTLEKVDLLHIDSKHSAKHVKALLEAHPKNVNKYILMHDYHTNGIYTEAEAFIKKSGNWKIKEVHKYNNGLGILERINN